jgi:hypothetical protein
MAMRRQPIGNRRRRGRERPPFLGFTPGDRSAEFRRDFDATDAPGEDVPPVDVPASPQAAPQAFTAPRRRRRRPAAPPEDSIF